jgi:hypothetical protein
MKEQPNYADLNGAPSARKTSTWPLPGPLAQASTYRAFGAEAEFSHSLFSAVDSRARLAGNRFKQFPWVIISPVTGLKPAANEMRTFNYTLKS